MGVFRLLFAGFFVALFTTIFGGTAYAASQYDNHLQTTDSYTMTTNNYYGIYHSFDSTNWKVDAPDPQYWYSQNSYNATYPSYESAINAPDVSLIVTKHTVYQADVNKYDQKLMVHIAPDGFNINFTADGVEACPINWNSSTLQYTSRQVQYANGGGAVFVFGSNGNCYPISTSVAKENADPTAGQYRVIMVQGNNTYNTPEGYSGLPLPVSEVGLTAFDYYVNAKNLKLINKTPDMPADAECRWYIDTNPAELYEEGDANNEKIIRTDCNQSPYEYVFGQLGWYQIGLAVTYPNGLDGESDRTTWDAYKTLYIDGTTFQGGADIHGDAVIADPVWEDCDLADFGCHLRNFWTTLRLGFMSLAVPSSVWAMNFIYDATAWMQDQFGLLYQSITIVIDQLNTMLDPTPSASLMSTGTFFNKTQTVGIDLSIMQEEMPVIYNVLINLCRGLFAFSLIFALNRRLFGFLDDLRL